MTLNEMRDAVKREIPIKSLLDKAPKEGYVCPWCGSGSGTKGTGGKVYPQTNSFFCHACKKGGDVIAIYEQVNGAGYKRAVEEMGATIGLYLDPQGSPARAENGKPKGNYQGSDEKPPTAPAQTQESEKDFSTYYHDCMNGLVSEAGLAAIEYLEEKRGIDLGLALDYRIGFDPAADPAGTGHPTPRLIIPTSNSHYVARRIDGKDDYKIMNPPGCTPGIFNLDVVYAQDVTNAQNIFIVEGAFDALSVIACGFDKGTGWKNYQAIALNSTSNVNVLLAKLEAKMPPGCVSFIVSLDNDPPGSEAAERTKKAALSLMAGLHRLGISYIQADISGACKDPNDAWTKDPDQFQEAIEAALESVPASRPDNVATYIDSMMGGDIERNQREIKTGFPSLDRETGGGLFAGLYCLAAVPSLGKTSLALQIADQVAAAGQDTIFFSLEMSRLELVSKSLSRTIAREFGEVCEAAAIRRGKMPARYAPAVEKYKETVQDRLSIVEGNFEANVSNIAGYVRRHMNRNGTQPVVIVDYVQILQPREDDSRKQRREALDNTILELKRLSREINTPVIIISSLNRTNYLATFSFESLKETGGLEYSCDCIWGLQLQCLREELFSKDKALKEKRERINRAKNEMPRKVELVSLKNRFGKATFSCTFDYFPDRDLFIDTGAADIFGDFADLDAAKTERKRIIK